MTWSELACMVSDFCDGDDLFNRFDAINQEASALFAHGLTQTGVILKWFLDFHCSFHSLDVGIARPSDCSLERK